jgi:hypothetical protein
MGDRSVFRGIPVTIPLQALHIDLFFVHCRWLVLEPSACGWLHEVNGQCFGGEHSRQVALPPLPFVPDLACVEMVGYTRDPEGDCVCHP